MKHIRAKRAACKKMAIMAMISFMMLVVMVGRVGMARNARINEDEW